MRADLLAASAQEVDGRLNRRHPSRPSFAKRTPFSLWKSRPYPLFDGLWGQAPGIGLHYAVGLY